MSSRKEEKERLRQERLAKEQAAAAAERRRRLMGILAGGVLAAAAVAAIVVAVMAGGGGSDDPKPNVDDGPRVPIPAQQTVELEGAAEAADCTLRTFAPGPDDRQHVSGPVRYRHNPPVFGPHDPQPASDGNYAGQGDVPREALVHSLEHGRVIIWYRPNLPQRRVSQLETLLEEPFAGKPGGYHQLLVADKAIPGAVAATTWGQQMICKAFTNKTFDALRTFRTRYVDKAPELVP